MWPWLECGHVHHRSGGMLPSGHVCVHRCENVYLLYTLGWQGEGEQGVRQAEGTLECLRPTWSSLVPFTLHKPVGR